MSTQPEYITESSEHYYLSIVSQEVKEELRRRHGNPKRHYHTWEHVRELFRMLERVDEALDCLPAVILAAAFHDVVYDATRRDNELRSAALMRKLTKGLDLFWVERADTLIMATVDHALPAGFGPNSDAGYFLDMDMAILGSPEDRYAQYIMQVRSEYGHLTDAQWRAGRVAFLRTQLAKLATDSLYHSEWGKAMFAANAKRNLSWELARLVESIDDESTAVPLEGK